MEDNYNTRCETNSYHYAAEKHTLVLIVDRFMRATKSRSRSEGHLVTVCIELEDSRLSQRQGNYARFEAHSHSIVTTIAFNKVYRFISKPRSWPGVLRVGLSKSPVTVHSQKYVKDNNYARFDAHSYHGCRETHFNVIVDRPRNRWLYCRKVLCHTLIQTPLILTLTSGYFNLLWTFS